MTLRAAALLFAWALGLSQAQAASPLAPLLHRIEGLAPAEAFRAVCADPVGELLALEGDAGAPDWLRLRAIDALARFPEDARARDFLVVSARRRAEAGSDRAAPAAHAALAVLLRTFPEAAESALAEALKHPDPQLRLTAARVARTGPDARLSALVSAWLAAPGDAEVKALVLPQPAEPKLLK